MAKAKDYSKTMKNLAWILSRLYNREVLSVKETAEELGISIRTAQRYFNNYLINNFPLKKVGRRWVLENVTKIVIDEESELALQTLEEMAKNIGTDFYQKIRPLLSKLYKSNYHPIYAKINIEDITDKMAEILELEKAIKNKNFVHCIYDFEDYRLEIDIKPLLITEFDGFWYLVAMDARNDIIKKYYLKHIFNVQIREETFAVSQEIEDIVKNSINIWFNPQQKPFEVRLFVDSVAAKYFKRKPIASTQAISGEDNDGSIEITLKITHEMEILPLIKSWIPHIFVLEPIWLADMVREDVRDYLERMEE